VAEARLVGIEVAVRLQARAIQDLSEDLGDLGLAVGRLEEQLRRLEQGTETLRAELAASRAATERAVSLVQELESRSLPGRIVSWAAANPMLTAAIIGMLLLFQSGYAYLIPSLLGGTHVPPPVVPGPVDVPSLEPAEPPARSHGLPD